ncbi:MAG: flagellar basal-body MS-ring/collar protein FliF [Paenibacillaceae bacterium]
MNERLAGYRETIVQYWKQTNRIQRIVFISSVVALILVLILTTYSLSRTEYSNAFTDLDSSDAAAISTYLTEQGIPYEFSADGRSIGVPTTQATQVKIDVESQGLMKNGSLGYGIFKENLSSFGMTDNEFGILKVDAIAGEIQQLINGMDGVNKSKVVIHVPEDSVFITEDTESSSASVLITFKTGFRPEQEMIDTFYNFVTHSLPNIDIEKITISDQKGELLPSAKLGGGLGNSSAIVAQQFMIRKQFENDVQRNVQSLLRSIFQADKVVVSVMSSLNFDKKNSVEQLVTAPNVEDQKGIEISIEKIQESYSSEGGSSGGVPGTGEGDVPGYPSGDSSGTEESEKLSEKINYDVNRISNEIVSSPYQIKDLTINVAVEPPDKNNLESLTQETKDAIQQILKNIVSASLADSGKVYTEEELAKKVYVWGHSFDGVTTVEQGSILTSGLFYGLGAIALAVVIVGTLLVFRRRKPEVEVEELVEPLRMQEFPTMDTVNNENQVKRQLESLAKKKPDEFVNLLRTWLADE